MISKSDIENFWTRGDIFSRVRQAMSESGLVNKDLVIEDLFPIDTFLEKAEKRVKLDLLFAELIKHFEIKVEKKDIDAFIEEESKRYKDAEQYKQWISGQPQQLDQFKMIVLERQLVEKLKNVLKSKKKVIEFSELANK